LRSFPPPIGLDGLGRRFVGGADTFDVLGVRAAARLEDRPELRGWKDTVYLRLREPVEIVMRFADYADLDTPYLYHCHVLFHEDQGMMGQFVVVEPG
jgi:FtsP/CotA-like multicopper oxidase with cupredoxin domain